MLPHVAAATNLSLSLSMLSSHTRFQFKSPADSEDADEARAPS